MWVEIQRGLELCLPMRSSLLGLVPPDLMPVTHAFPDVPARWRDVFHPCPVRVRVALDRPADLGKKA